VGASVTLGAAGLEVVPGGEAYLEVRVRNTGTVVDEFAVDVLGDAAPWATAEPPTLSLFPGAEGTTRVTFQPPRAPAVRAGSVPFGVRVQSREDPAGSSVEEGLIDIAPFLEPFAELVPRTSRGSRGATHEVAIDNRGNVATNADVEGSDADRLLRFEVVPPGVVVEPGMAGFAKVQVAPVERFWRGPSKTRPFQLLVRPEGTPPITLDGSFVQEAILPPWTGRAITALIGLLIALVLLWFFVLRPAIEAAASEAVESPLAELRDDVSDALEAGGLPPLGDGGGNGGDASPSPDPDATPGAGTPAPTAGPVIPGLGNPVHGRLLDGAASVEPTTTLFVTDLVFSNPNGKSGTLTLSTGSEVLYQLNLENFRDLDFHFVTPIVVVPGDSLSLALTCTSDPPCDPSVFFSGYLRP
jgi:hypothetical protein